MNSRGRTRPWSVEQTHSAKHGCGKGIDPIRPPNVIKTTLAGAREEVLL